MKSYAQKILDEVTSHLSWYLGGDIGARVFVIFPKVRYRTRGYAWACLVRRHGTHEPYNRWQKAHTHHAWVWFARELPYAREK